jgi:hypothetical protein
MITIRDFIEAGRKNGYPVARNGNYINIISSKITTDDGMIKSFANYYDKPELVQSACFIGQSGINLKINPAHLASAVTRALTFYGKYSGMIGVIALTNDRTDWSLHQIADFLTDRYHEVLDIDIEPFITYGFIDTRYV